MQIVSIGDNLHEMSNAVFQEKIRKVFQYVLWVQSVKENGYTFKGNNSWHEKFTSAHMTLIACLAVKRQHKKITNKKLHYI